MASAELALVAKFSTLSNPFQSYYIFLPPFKVILVPMVGSRVVSPVRVPFRRRPKGPTHWVLFLRPAKTSHVEVLSVHWHQYGDSGSDKTQKASKLGQYPKLLYCFDLAAPKFHFRLRLLDRLGLLELRIATYILTPLSCILRPSSQQVILPRAHTPESN